MNKQRCTEKLVKFITVNEARERYKLNRNTLMKIAEQNGAVFKLGRTVRIDIEILDKVIEENYKKGR